MAYKAAESQAHPQTVRFRWVHKPPKGRGKNWLPGQWKSIIRSQLSVNNTKEGGLPKKMQPTKRYGLICKRPTQARLGFLI